ncbi:MAG: InlB B-repeat-containing protein, partial [Bacteroidales bacterium]|nr:InlB B-repeat-containing protein [Bacteroidales bacterium]
VGFVGQVSGTAVVKNLGIVDSYFSSSYNYLGSIVGGVAEKSSVTIANVYSTSTVEGENYIGGLVGGSGKGSVTIVNSYFAGKTSSTFLSGQYNTHHDDLVSGEFGTSRSGTLDVVNTFVLGTSQYGTSVTAEQLSDGTVAAALHYYQDALADGSMWGISDGKTNFSGTIDGVSVTTADVTLHTFDGDATTYSSKYIVGNTTPLPVNVVREGYTFSGWYDNADFEGDAVTQIPSSATGDKEYWAKFVRSHSVSFVLNDGNIRKGEIDHYIEGETTVLPTYVTKVGASFEGWYTTEDFTGDRYYSIPATATEDMTFYAKWGAEKTTFYLMQGSPEPVHILYEGENMVWLDKTTMDGYVISDNSRNPWGSNSDINVPYTGGESTFGNGGRAFNVAQSGFYVFTLTDMGEGNWFVSVLRSVYNCTIATQTYTGSAIEPEIVCDGITLVKGTDYDVLYSDNTNVGTATAKITGIGNYSGTVDKPFTISPKVTNLGALTITEDQNGATATFDASSSATITITETIEVKTVIIKRAFTAERPSTMILPFQCDASKFGGSFHTVSSVEYNETTHQWEAKASAAVATMQANTPYLFKPSQNTSAESPIVINAAEGETISLVANNSEESYTNVGKKDGSDEDSEWQLVGVYCKKTWMEDSKTEYGFSAVDVAEDGIVAGEFVRAGSGAWMNPMRCFLRYTGSDARFMSKSAPILPQTIRVIFPDETASVVDPTIPEPSSDITTPVSEIAPNSGTRVWSYDKKIVIESNAGDQYRIIDLSGRTLRESSLAADREEITLSSKTNGIVIVVINGKTFKVNY